MIIPLVFRVWY